MCEKCGCSSALPPQPRHTGLEAGLSDHDRLAEQNRGFFRAKGVFVVNLLSFAGSGARQLVDRTLADLGDRLRIATLTPDMVASIHADHAGHGSGAAVAGHDHALLDHGTGSHDGGNLHMDAHRVAHATEHLDLDGVDLLLIVNGGSAACQAAYDLGENAIVALFAARDGALKPLKFPHFFGRAAVVAINAVENAAEEGCDLALARASIAKVAPAARILELSPASGAGMDNWYAYLCEGVGK